MDKGGNDGSSGTVRNSRFWPPSDPPMFWATIGTLVVVGCYTWYTRSQVNGLLAANDIAKNAAIVANRPYVTTDGVQPLRTADHRGVLGTQIGLIVHNWGNSPASSVEIKFCDPLVRPNLDPPAYNCIISSGGVASSVIAPKQQVTMGGPVIADADLGDTRDETKAIYIFGRITYNDYVDVYENGAPRLRVTWFCDKIQETTERSGTPPYAVIPLPPAQTPIRVDGCPVLNCADEDCRSQQLPKMD